MVVIEHTAFSVPPIRKIRIRALFQRSRTDEWETLVLFLAGPLPPPHMRPTGMDDREAVIELLRMLCIAAGDTPDSADWVDFALSWGAAVAVIRVDTISDETSDVITALRKTVYRDIEYGSRVAMTSAINELETPMRSGMACFVKKRAQ